MSTGEWACRVTSRSRRDFLLLRHLDRTGRFSKLGLLSRPPLISSRSARRLTGNLGRYLRTVRSHRRQTEFQQQFICDPLLAPSRVVTRPLPNQMLKFGGNRPPASFALPAPEGGGSPCGARRRRSWASPRSRRLAN